MPSRTTYTVGTPCWVDLFVPDPAAAERFYGAVFGWTVGVSPAEGYRFMEHGGAVVAGIGQQDETGAPPVWSTYVRVAELEPAVARAVELGGSVAVEPFPIPGSGRIAVLQDPQGAVFHLWEPQGFAGAAVVNEAGAWAWNDLQTPDPAAAAPFYAALFGWTIAEAPGSDGAYWPVAHEGRSIGGVMRSPVPGLPPAWSVYVGTADVEAALTRIADAGGRRLVDPTAVPAGRFAVAADDQGAVICLVEAAFDD
jgi:predicted enzyme related to lactoylglutathione lyase